MKLARLQRKLVASVCGAPPDPDLLGLITGDDRADPWRRLGVYRDTVRETHLQTLETAFPVCVEILGRRYWRQLLGRAGRRQGGPLRDLARHGAAIPLRLEAAVRVRPELAGFDYLPHLARLEWGVHRARYAADDPVFDLAAFGRAAEHGNDTLRLMTSASLRLGVAPWPVDALWRTHRRGQPPVELNRRESHYCVHRGRDFEPAPVSLAACEARLLRAVRNGADLASLERMGTGSLSVASLLHEWIMRGWIVDFSEAAACSTTAS